jgi:hypothetical protein
MLVGDGMGWGVYVWCKNKFPSTLIIHVCKKKSKRSKLTLKKYLLDNLGLLHETNQWNGGNVPLVCSGSNVGDVGSLMGSQWGPTDSRGGKMEPFPKPKPADGGKSKL